MQGTYVIRALAVMQDDERCLRTESLNEGHKLHHHMSMY